MNPFDGRKGKRLSYEIVGNMRFFGFYIGNDTLLIQDNIDLEIVYEKSEHLGMLYALELFGGYTNNTEYQGIKKQDFISIKNYVKSAYRKEIVLFNRLPFTKKELQTDKNWRSVIARFFMDFGLLRLDTIPLKEWNENYTDDIIDYGSGLELLTAIICNIIRFDKNYNVINEDWVRYRASQYIRSYHDKDYNVKPAFKIWETSLWC